MTLRDTIKRAMRMLGVLAAGTEPEAADAADCKAVLQSLLMSLPGSSWWVPVEITAAYTPGENERIRVTTPGAVTVTLPTAVSSAEPMRACCNQVELVCTGYDDRAPKDGARVQIVAVSGGATTEATYRYRADTGEWLPVNDLGLSAQIPLNLDLHDGLAAMLAVRIAPEYGVPVSNEVAGMAQQATSTMRARFGKREAQGVDTALIRTSSNCTTF